jgi:hypothetical protein
VGDRGNLASSTGRHGALPILLTLARTNLLDQERCRAISLYSRSVNESFFAELSAWLTQAGLAGLSETDIVSGFCDRGVAAGLPIARAIIFVDTLHPVHEGRLFRWGYGPTESPVLD